MMAGDKEEAYLLAKRLNEYNKRRGELNLQVSHRIGYAYHRVRKYEEAKTYFDQQIRFSEESIRLNRMLSRWNAAQYDLAATYAFIGETGKAYKYLEEFNKKSDLSLWWILLLKYDPLFQSIRNEPEFQNIVKDMETKYQAEHERVKKWLEEQGML
jgi:tetratricopeptide (TPR) repeat protein